MSGVIAALTLSAGATLYTAEENRKAKSDADERLKQDKIKVAGEQAFNNVKKENNDNLASAAAMRLREQTKNQVGVTIPGAPAPQDLSLGLLGLGQPGPTTSNKKTGGI